MAYRDSSQKLCKHFKKMILLVGHIMGRVRVEQI